ncbi:unnamed protein product, partial [Mesorhabditis belari]|uniref:Uncharacterized protein n=1 Tax=Mesorhabditis belari TaxID=2138241 RepID=A0AAF3F688_9BILA
MSAGASQWFGASVAHSIHSINVRALQKFEPSTTEKNSVPTVNLDLSADRPILSHAPDRRGPSDSMYLTDGMKTLDEVLSHMGDKKWDIGFFSPLERVVHVFHMQEAWEMTLKEYQKLKQNPPSSDVCKCAKDIENNGASLIYGDTMKAYNTSLQYYIQGGYTYRFKPERVFKESERGLSLDQILLKEKESMPKLTDAAAWEKWKEIGKMSMTEHFDTALFFVLLVE